MRKETSHQMSLIINGIVEQLKQKSRYKTEMHPPVVLSSSSLELTQSMLYDSVLIFPRDKFCHFLQKNIANFVEKWVLLVKILLIFLFWGKESPNFQYLKIEKEPLDHTQTSLALLLLSSFTLDPN